MIRTSTICGVLLVLLGVGVYAYLSSGEEKASPTALIPAFAGGLILLCTAVALKPSLRKHAMHGVAVLALLGAALPLGRLGMAAATGKLPPPLAASSLVGMAVISGYLLWACIQSFRAARRAREAAE